MKLLLIDDHPMFAEGLSLVLQQSYSGVECSLAASLAEGLAALAAVAFDLVLTDLNLPDSAGLATLTALRQAYPQVPSIVISADDRKETVIAAVDGGAAGFVPKTARYADMLKAMNVVVSGGTFLPSTALNGYTQSTNSVGNTTGTASNIEALTPRQRDVLRLLLQGKPNKLICRALDLSEATVKTHLAAIFRTLDVNSRTEAVLVAARSGIAV